MTSCSGLGEAITPEGTGRDENFNAIVSTVDSYVVRMGDSTDSSGNVRRAYSLRQIASSQRFSGFRAEFDSHADTCVVGKHCWVIHDWQRPVDVYGWNAKDKKRVCRIVSAVIGYERPDNGQLVLLVIHQAIHCPSLHHHLLSPFQLRCNGITVNETQKLFVNEPSMLDHAMICKEEDGERLVVPLHITRVTSYFHCRMPTAEEMEDNQILQVELTSQTVTWNPDDDTFAIREESLLDNLSANVAGDSLARGRLVGISQVSHHSCATEFTADDTLGHALEDKLRVDSFELGCPTGDPMFWLNAQVDNAIPDISAADIDDEGGSAYVGSLRSTNSSFQSLCGAVGTRSYLNSRQEASIIAGRRKAVDSETLSERFDISRDMARKTVESTTQRGVRPNWLGLQRRVSTNDRMLRYPRVHHKMYTDTLHAGAASWMRQNKFAQVYATSFGWTRAYPMKLEKDGPSTLDLLFSHIGVPDKMIGDDSKMHMNMSQGGFKRKLIEAGSMFQALEPMSQWGNAAELRICELKRRSGRTMTKTGCPRCLWDHSLEMAALIESATAKDIFMLNGQVPETLMRGETFDISALCQHGFYDWVRYREPTAQYPEENRPLGRYLGPINDVGSGRAAKILLSNGEYIVRTTFEALSKDELADPVQAKARDEWDRKLKERLGDERFQSLTESDLEALGGDWVTPKYEEYEDWQDEELSGAPDDLPPTPDFADDIYKNVKISVPRGGVMCPGKVTKRVTDSDGNPLGREHELPPLDTRRYVVEFEDGDEIELAANVIAQRMVEDVDAEGNDLNMLEAFVDWRKGEDALSLSEQCVEENGKTFARRSTAGWEICCKWKHGSTSWEALSDLKECYPAELAQYAIKCEIDHEPAFNWWVRPVLKKRARIVSSIKGRAKVAREKARGYNKRTSQFGIQIPKSVADAKALDKENGNTLWQDAIAKETASVRPAFKPLPHGQRAPPGYKWIRCHWIFTVKMEDFRRKARLVAGGHMTGDVPPTLTYASVVSRDTVRIALTMAALNDLSVKTADIQNAYIKAPCTEKVYTTLGDEFGEDAGKQALVVRALYGLKSSGAAFRNHLAECMRHLEYVPCRADPDLWMKPAVRSDGFEYWEYVLLYVDDVLAIGEYPSDVLTKIDKYFGLKPGSIADPNHYLGARVRPMTMENGVICWAISASQYVQEAVKNVRDELKKMGDDRWKLPKQAVNPFPMDYDLDSDISPELGPELASSYQ